MSMHVTLKSFVYWHPGYEDTPHSIFFFDHSQWMTTEKKSHFMAIFLQSLSVGTRYYPTEAALKDTASSWPTLELTRPFPHCVHCKHVIDPRQPNTFLAFWNRLPQE